METLGIRTYSYILPPIHNSTRPPEKRINRMLVNTRITSQKTQKQVKNQEDLVFLTEKWQHLLSPAFADCLAPLPMGERQTHERPNPKHPELEVIRLLIIQTKPTTMIYPTSLPSDPSGHSQERTNERRKKADDSRRFSPFPSDPIP